MSESDEGTMSVSGVFGRFVLVIGRLVAFVLALTAFGQRSPAACPPSSGDQASCGHGGLGSTAIFSPARGRSARGGFGGHGEGHGSGGHAGGGCEAPTRDTGARTWRRSARAKGLPTPSSTASRTGTRAPTTFSPGPKSRPWRRQLQTWRPSAPTSRRVPSTTTRCSIASASRTPFARWCAALGGPASRRSMAGSTSLTTA